MNEAFEQAKYDWYSHDEWRLADREATYKFFHTAGLLRAAEVADDMSTKRGPCSDMYEAGYVEAQSDIAAAIRKEVGDGSST